MTLVLAFLAGLLTLINPCVLPVLPIVLASATQSHRLGPVALAAGMAISFVTLGLLVATLGQTLPAETVTLAAALMMMAFGLILLIPALADRFARLTNGLSRSADRGIDALPQGLLPQTLAGALLGAVWSPCIGPTLGSAISLASQGRDLGWAALIMAAFAAGVCTVILALAYGARSLMTRWRGTLRRVAAQARPILGGVLALTGLALALRLNQPVEGWLVDHLPFWLQDFSVSL